MQVEPKVVVRGIVDEGVIEARAREEVAQLEKFFDRITSCRVLVEHSSHMRRQGNLFHVRVDLVVPGKEIVVRREPPQDHAHEDVFVALRDAFKATRRQLEDYVRSRRGDVKRHDSPTAHGKVIRLSAEQGHGFLEAADGHQVYFHRNSLAHGRYEDLRLGTVVEFDEEAGTDGPQAARVRVTPGVRPPTV
jgi:cold shock CspA family protein